jgi:hypothetical protein
MEGRKPGQQTSEHSIQKIEWQGVLKFVAHGRQTLEAVIEHGWRPGARYTNLRDIRHVAFAGQGFLDIHWKRYDFERHLEAAAASKPFITVARDVEKRGDLKGVLREADELARHAHIVVIVPKDPLLANCLNTAIPAKYLLGYSVPTRYGATPIPPDKFRRPVHLLGGRPDTQRRLAAAMPVVSLDCNRFTLDAEYGDYFDGDKFRPHPEGGYARCIRDSMTNIDRLWHGYQPMYSTN